MTCRMGLGTVRDSALDCPRQGGRGLSCAASGRARRPASTAPGRSSPSATQAARSRPTSIASASTNCAEDYGTMPSSSSESRSSSASR